MKDLQQLERKSLQSNKTAQSIVKRKSGVVPSTAERKTTGSTGSIGVTNNIGGSKNNVNYE